MRKFSNDERFDIGLGRLFVVDIRTHIADVRIRQAHDLTGIARIGENFLVTSEAGIKNDFAAATGDCTRRASVKDSSVLEREYRATFGGLLQCVVLQKSSFRCRIHR